MPQCPDCDSHLDHAGRCVICGYRLPRRLAPRPPVEPYIPPSPEQAAKARALVAGLVAQFSIHAGRPVPAGVEAESWARVRAHVDRLRARGLEEGAAWRLAEALVGDARHREHCAVCGGSSDG